MAERSRRSRFRGDIGDRGRRRLSRDWSFRRKDSTPGRAVTKSGRRSSSSRNCCTEHGGGVVLRRTVSEPILWHWDWEESIEFHGKITKKKEREKDKEKWLGRPQTLSDLFDGSHTIPWLPPRTPTHKSEKPECDKILVNVTVEGSSGPIRQIVKKVDTVSDLIKITIKNYAKEGRHPVLDSNTDIFELYLSNFSMESLKRSDVVGELGSRAFFLRQENREDSGPDLFTPTPGPLFFSVLMRRMKKIGRRTRKFWKLVDCMVCG